MVTIFVDEMQYEQRCTHRIVVECPADMNRKKGKSSGYARAQGPVRGSMRWVVGFALAVDL